MSSQPDEDRRRSELRDPEITGAPDERTGASERRFLGVPAWATAVAFAALAAIAYLLMLTLG